VLLNLSVIAGNAVVISVCHRPRVAIASPES
jgi:hypothetical protein